jgi:hypothetical protein
MPVLDQRFLRQTRFDSALPAGTGVVVHRFARDGEFQLHVRRGEETVQRVRVNVGRGPGGRDDDDSGGKHGGPRQGRPAGAADPLAAEPPPAGGTEAPTARVVALDVTTLLRPSAQPPALDDLPSRGYLSITSSQPMAEHHIVVGTGDKADDVLDTRRLGSRSLFAVTLIRPGRYRLVNAVTGSEAAVVVTYPQLGKTPYRPPAALEIQCTADGFGAREFRISPAQGIVFRFATESRIQLELVEPDDGPEGGQPRPKASFRRPPATD